LLSPCFLPLLLLPLALPVLLLFMLLLLLLWPPLPLPLPLRGAGRGDTEEEERRVKRGEEQDEGSKFGELLGGICLVCSLSGSSLSSSPAGLRVWWPGTLGCWWRLRLLELLESEHLW